MASGITLEEAEGRKPDGFFPKVFENVCKTLTPDQLDATTDLKGDTDKLMRFSYDLPQFKEALQIREFYPEKNPHEAKIKKEYGNKAYQDGKDIDALYFYTQVTWLSLNCSHDTSGAFLHFKNFKTNDVTKRD